MGIWTDEHYEKLLGEKFELDAKVRQLKADVLRWKRRELELLNRLKYYEELYPTPDYACDECGWSSDELPDDSIVLEFAGDRETPDENKAVCPECGEDLPNG